MALSIQRRPTADEARRRTDDAEELGRVWAETVRAALEQDGRRPAGGWPGTISEARAKVEASLDPAAKKSIDERERLARLLYHSARAAWLATRVAADED